MSEIYTEECSYCGHEALATGTAGKGLGYNMECSYCGQKFFDSAHREARHSWHTSRILDDLGPEAAAKYDREIRALDRLGEN